jgi:hypothetical protein
VAQSHYEVGLGLAQRAGNPFVIGRSLVNLGDVSCWLGNPDSGAALSEETLTVLGPTQHPCLERFAGGTLAWIDGARVDRMAAGRRWEETLATALTFDTGMNPSGQITALVGIRARTSIDFSTCPAKVSPVEGTIHWLGIQTLNWVLRFIQWSADLVMA